MTITNSTDKDAANKSTHKRSLRKIDQLIPKINKVLHFKLQVKAPTEATQGKAEHKTALSESRKMLKIKEIKEFRRWWVLIIRNKWCLLARARGISVWTRQLVEQHKEKVKPRVSMDRGIAGRSNSHRRFWKRRQEVSVTSRQPELVELKSVTRYKKRRIWWRSQEE